MFNIIQSHRTEYLVEQLLTAYQSKDVPIFEEFVVIVPSMVLGDWLDKSIATKAGISTLVTTKFWGQYQWTLMQKVLAKYNQHLEQSGFEHEMISVPEVAVLTGAVMQWRLFGYFTYYRFDILDNPDHALHPIVAPLLDANSDDSQKEARLWSLATDFARVFGRYLTHREDWLDDWSEGRELNVSALIAEKDELSLRFDKDAQPTPDWLVAHYTELEKAQRYLWQLLFAPVYQHRAAIEARFWQLVEDNLAGDALNIHALLPRQLHIFTIQQLPQNELDFLYRLSNHIDITLLHYNPSRLFWADIVDKQWLQRQKIINPESVFLSDYGHTLLSRLGKQSRETFAMLANLSGNEYYDDFKLNWQNRFDIDDFDIDRVNINESADKTKQPLSLLAQLQQDVLMLDERATQQATVSKLSSAIGAQLALDLADDEPLKNSLSSSLLNSNDDNDDENQLSDEFLSQKFHAPTRKWAISKFDNSLSIHSCHSLQRQLEVLRSMIGRWLNEKKPDGSKYKRHLSDIVVLLPDVERHYDLISSVFVSGQGQDGLTLPAKITGVVDKTIRQLWEAISGFYRLLGSDSARFEAASVLDWLMLPPLYESLGLTHEQMSRGCDLLLQAGFIRGFDEAHLQQFLNNKDYDYRFSFAFALDQIALGLVMPEAGMTDCLYPDHWREDALAEKTLPISSISLDDAPIIEALCRIHSGLNHCRNEYQKRKKAEDWLANIEEDIIHLYFGKFDQTPAMRTVFKAMNGFKGSLRANGQYKRYKSHSAQSAATVEAQLSKVSTLPLKLSFILDSIEDELESQQVSAEPTGVITFGRFGALRNVPFGLVVMLNMDLAEFPNRDRDNRYDLMKAGRSRRGDRLSEDDDNGAFLDALLCARSACWIFYNGQRVTDAYEHLPANPVSELLQFLQGEVDWQWSQLATDTVIDDDVQRQMGKLIEKWFVTQHPALPFADEVFLAPNIDPQADGLSTAAILDRAMQNEKLAQKQSTAPAKVWQNVFERLQVKPNGDKAPIVTLPKACEYQAIAQQILGQNEPVVNEPIIDISHVDLQYLFLQVRHPAKHFLRHQNVHIVLPSDDIAHQEPLALDGLGAYAINDTLISNLYQATSKTALVNDAQELLYHPVMPAGVARKSTLNLQQLTLKKRCQAFLQSLTALGISACHPMSEITIDGSLALITPTAETVTSVSAMGLNSSETLTIKGIAPISLETAPSLWLNMLPNSARAPHLLKFWLMHLFWQVSRKTTPEQVALNDGQSIWNFKLSNNGTIFSFAPIAYEVALSELLKWIRFSELSGQIPMAILPEFALEYLKQLEKTADYQPQRKDFLGWFAPSFGSDTIYDSCSKHELWQYILQSQDAYLALKNVLPTLSPVLFGAMQASLIKHD